MEVIEPGNRYFLLSIFLIILLIFSEEQFIQLDAMRHSHEHHHHVNLEEDPIEEDDEFKELRGNL